MSDSFDAQLQLSYLCRSISPFNLSFVRLEND